MVRYTEKQRFTQWWLWLILLPVSLLPFYGIYQQIILGRPFGNNPLSDTGLYIFAAFMLAFLGFFYAIRLTMVIDEEGVFVHFFPILKRKAKWEEIEDLQIVDYGFVGGYGIRLTGKFGTVYNTSGRHGLLIFLKNGKRFCVGTKRKEDLQKFVMTLAKKRSV